MTSPIVTAADALKDLVAAEPAIASSSITVSREWVPTTKAEDIGDGLIEVLPQDIDKEAEKRSAMKTTDVFAIALSFNANTKAEQDAAMEIATTLMDYLENKHLASIGIFMEMDPGPLVDGDAWKLGIFRTFITLKYRRRN
jgi:hypothetical protein